MSMTKQEFDALKAAGHSGANAREAVTQAILKKCKSQTGVDTVRPLFGTTFGLSGVMIEAA